MNLTGTPRRGSTLNKQELISNDPDQDESNPQKKCFFKRIISQSTYSTEAINMAASKTLSEIKIWGLYEPDINIIFYADNDHVPSNRIKESLKLGLLEIIKSTCPLIITNGQNKGTSKIIGNAIRSAFEMSDTNKQIKIKLLGITDQDLSMPISLEKVDRNHSHFIFLDRNIKTSDYMKKLQNKLYDYADNEENSNHVPTILIVLNKSNASLETIKNSLDNKIPVLLIKERRGVSDLLSNMLDRFKKKSLLVKHQILEDENSWYNFCSFIPGIIPANEISLLRKILQMYHESIVKNKAILIETVSFETESDQLPIEILKTLSNAYPIQTSESFLLYNILILATKWNKIEMATQIFDEIVPIFNFDGHLNDFVYLINEAIMYNRPEIFQLFLDEYPQIIKNYIHPLSLYFLYNFKKKEEDVLEAPFSVLYKREQYLQDQDTFFTFQYIHEKLEELIGIDLSENILCMNSADMEFKQAFDVDKVLYYGCLPKEIKSALIKIKYEARRSKVELFIWCILFNRPHIAKVILPKLKNQIAYALVASIIFRKFYEKTSLKAFLDSSEEFEDLAIQILEYFDLKEDDEYNMKLLYDFEIKYLKCKLMYLAYKGKCRKFVSSLTVYKTIRLMWISSDLKVNKVRIDHNIQKLNSDVFDSKMFLLVLSNLSYGFLAPFLLYKKNELPYSTSTQSIPIKNDESEKQEEKFSEQNKKSFTYLEKYKDFVKSPQILFTYDAIIHFMFLLTFSYWLLSGSFFQAKASNSFTNQTSDPNLIPTTYDQSNVTVEITGVEFLIIIWAFLYFFQIIREIYILKKENIWNNWNHINFFGCLLFFLGILVKNMSREDEIREISRLILCIDLLVWYIRSLGIFMCFQTLGPKLIMIRKMMWDILSFITIVFVFLLAYGVTIQTMMRLENLNHRTKSQNLFDISYWPIFGEITFLKEIQENVQLSKYASYYGYISTAIYMFIANVLLLNLLIAMFNNTFNSIEQNATEIWKYQYFKVVYEYHLCAKYRLLPLPSIFTLIDFCTIGLRSIYYFFIRCFKLNGQMQENEHTSLIYSEMSIIFSNDSIISSATSKKSDENEVLDSNANNDDKLRQLSQEEKIIIKKEKNYSKIVLKSQKNNRVACSYKSKN